MNEIDMTPIEFACVDDRLLFAELNGEMEGRNLSPELHENVAFILNDLITVVDCVGPFANVEPAIVTVTDEQGNQIKDWKFSCRRLDISLNFFDKGFWLTIEVGNLKQKMPLSWERYKDRLIPDGTVFH